MSTYFKNFPIVKYNFGDEVNPSIFQKVSSYVDILDQVKVSGTFYNNVYIQQGDRPDTLSYKLYGTDQYYWTFFLLNDHLRESGWPMGVREINLLSEQYYPNKVVVTRDNIYTDFGVGKEVSGSTSGAVGTIIARNLDLGQLVINSNMDFLDGEQLSYTEDDTVKSLLVYSTMDQYLATHHYELEGIPLDIDPSVYEIGLAENVTNRDHLVRRNEELKSIRALRGDIVAQVVGEWSAAMRGRS